MEKQSLYKYASINEYTIQNINNSKIYLCNFSELNDVYEGMGYIEYDKINNLVTNIKQSYNYSEFSTTNSVDGINEKVYNNIKQNEELTEYYIKNLGYQLLITSNKSFYVASLTKTHDSAIMWAHYANDCRGIMIEYEISDSTYKDVDYITEVEYSTKRVNLTEPLIKYIGSGKNDGFIYVTKDIQCRLATVKSSYWSYENEYRCIVVDQNPHQNGPLKVTLSLPIKSITLGMRISEEDKEKILKCAKENNIPVFGTKMIIDAKDFPLRYVDFEE